MHPSSHKRTSQRTQPFYSSNAYIDFRTSLNFTKRKKEIRSWAKLTRRNSQAELLSDNGFFHIHKRSFTIYYFYGRVSLFPLLSHVGDIFCLVPRALTKVQRVLESK